MKYRKIIKLDANGSCILDQGERISIIWINYKNVLLWLLATAERQTFTNFDNEKGVWTMEITNESDKEWNRKEFQNKKVGKS